MCAPSGKAALLINGVTLHTAFALPVSQFSSNMPELSADIANSIREKLFHLKLLIIDEISMVGSTLLGRVDTRLRQIMGKNDKFGGLSVIVVGDLSQLPPVMDSPLYKFVRNEFSVLIDRNPLWDEFSFYELTEVMRQKEDLEFVQILNNIARGDVHQRDIDILNTRVVNPTDIPRCAIRLFNRNVDVDIFNRSSLDQHEGTEYTATAKDSIVGETTAKKK